MSNQTVAKQRENLERLLASRIGKFTPPEYLRTGGVRNLYRTNVGPNGEIQAVVKIEREDVESPRARRHLERGCTTESEIRHVINLDVRGVTKMVDYFSAEEAAAYGINGAVIVEEFRPDSVSLEEHVSQNGPLNKKQLRQFTRKYAQTVRTVRAKGILHRDQKPSNILLEFDKKGNVSEVFLTDWANAAKVDELRPSAWPTAGGHDAMHPKIMPAFAPREGNVPLELIYDDSCEIYGMAHNIALAARGRKIFDYDPDRGTAIEWDTGQSVLTEGLKDSDKHNAALKRATRKMSPNLGAIVKDGMSLDNSAYETMEQFTLNAIHSAREPSTWLQRTKWGGLVAAIGLAIAGAGFALHQIDTANERAQASEQKYEERRRMQMIREFLGDRRRNTTESFIETDKIGALVEILGDEKAAFSAYLDADSTYEAIQKNGGKTAWNDIKETMRGLNYTVYSDLEISTPGEYLDNWMITGRQQFRDTIKKEWQEVGRRYEAKKLATSKPSEQYSPMGGDINRFINNGFPPNYSQTSQPSQPEIVWPVPEEVLKQDKK